MSKLTRYEKSMRKAAKANLIAVGGMVVAFPDERVTVAIAPACQGQGKTEFAHVAVAYCSEHDEFKRKRGELQAMDRFEYERFPLRWPVGLTLEDMAELVATWFFYPH